LKKSIVLALVSALCISVSAHADEASKDRKIRELLKLQGLTEMLDQQRESAKTQAVDAGKEAFQQAVGDIAKVPAAERPKLDRLIERYVEKADSLLAKEDIEALWVKTYGANVSEAHVDEVIAFYNSPAGKLEVEVTKKTLPVFFDSISETFTRRIKVALEVFSKEVKDEMVKCCSVKR
jgi:hypothetical protein